MVTPRDLEGINTVLDLLSHNRSQESDYGSSFPERIVEREIAGELRREGREATRAEA
jgi:hypothetical protein